MKSPAPAFDNGYFTRLDAARDHWWVRGMQEAARSLLGPTGPGLSVLDAGCGVGTNIGWLADLARPNPVVAVDFASPALERLRHGGQAHVVQASVTHLPLASGHFDLVLTADVLQHLTAEAASAALSEMRRVLRPGGRLLARTNSAFGRSAVSVRDDWRLYTAGTLGRSLAEAGLVVERLTAVNATQGLWASIPRRPPRPHHHCAGGGDPGAASHHGLGIPAPTSAVRNALLTRIMRAEARWLGLPGRRLPFGHSLYALARRPA